MVQKLWPFYRKGGFCLLVELHWEGSESAAYAAGLFYKVVRLDTGGSVVNGATLSSLLPDPRGPAYRRLLNF